MLNLFNTELGFFCCFLELTDIQYYEFGKILTLLKKINLLSDFEQKSRDQIGNLFEVKMIK